MEFTVLAIGDVVANAGLDCLHHHLRALKKEYGVHFCIVNGENTANGLGISPHQAEELFDAGADVITLGNHAFPSGILYRIWTTPPIFFAQPIWHPRRQAAASVSMTP